MSAPTRGQQRLQRALVSLVRASAARRPAGRPGREASPGEPTIRPRAAAAPEPAAVPEPAAAPEASSGSAAPVLEAWAASLADLSDRLERIEERVADLHRPVRPQPATRDLFSEWVRLRRWEEIPFGDFLRLRRAGLL